MKLALAFAALALLGLVRADDDEQVVTLTDENFDDFISSNPLVLVEFYAPWCGHCKALAPEYEKAAAALHADPDVKTILAKVDATEEGKAKAGKYGVKGFPTLKFFTGDLEKPQEYGGGRTESTIISWVKKRELPAVSILEDAAAVEKFKTNGDAVVVGFFAEDAAEVETLKKTGDLKRDAIAVGVVSSEDVAKELGATMGSVVMYRTFDDPTVTMEGEVTMAALDTFIEAERFKLIDMIGPENYKDYMDRGLPLVWIALDPSDDAEMALLDNLQDSAKAAKGKLSFTYIDSKKFAQHVENLGMTSTPGILIADGADKYLFDGDLAEKAQVTEFFTQYEAGTLGKFLKTEAVPESNDEPVYVLVGSEFENVIGQDKDVFVEFYAPWCGHCKKLAPEYEKVGEAFKDVEDVIVAKIDATANDTPEEIKGFPTLIFYPRGSTTGQRYSGDRDAAGIAKYIKENSKADSEALAAINHDEL